MAKDNAIIAIGTATPPYRRKQSDVADFLSQSLKLSPAQTRLLKSIYKATGIQYRYTTLNDGLDSQSNNAFFPKNAAEPLPSTAQRMEIYKANALPLAINATKNCVSQLDAFNKADITHVITVSCTGMYAPGLDIEIVKHFNLNTSVKRTCINFMGCYGAFNAIKLADSICKAEPKACVLIVSVELCSIHFQKSERKENVISNAIFADGAAAMLVQSALPYGKYFSINDFYCDLLPQSEDQMAWTIGNSGFDIVLSAYVPHLIESGIVCFMKKLLDQHALALSDIDLFAIHPGGVKILEACENALHLTQAQNQASYHVLKNYGNMSSATVLFVLQHLWENLTAVQEEKTIFSCAFGPGLTLESMLLKVHYENN